MRRRPRVAGCLLAAAAAAAAAACACGQTLPNLTGEEPTGEPNDSKWLRIRGFESSSPPGEFTRAFREVGQEALEAVVGMVEHFEDVVSDRTVPNCMLRQRADGGIVWGSKIESFVEYRQWKLPSLGCISSTIGVRKPKLRLSGEQVYSRLQRMGELNEMVKDVVFNRTARRISETFTSLVVPRSFDYEQGRYQVCKIERATAVRVMSTKKVPLWYILQGMTNDDVGRTLADKERRYITEFTGVSLEGGIEKTKFIDPLWCNVKPVGEGNENETRAHHHTFLEEWKGRVGVSGMYAMEIRDSPALQQSLHVTDRDVDQAKDALTPSNIAILSLPMVMNLIPISCLTQLSSTGILVFTLLSDVLTTVPFIIKGYELLSMGNRRTVREETYYTDPSKGNFLILETWAAECRMKDVKTYGWLFILLGFAVLVMGVFCEFQAARLRRRWTKDGVLVIPGKKKIFETFLGRDVSSENDDETGLPFFDPDDEAAAFKAQQQAVLVRSSGNA